jgi:hypothetical protein
MSALLLVCGTVGAVSAGFTIIAAAGLRYAKHLANLDAKEAAEERKLELEIELGPELTKRRELELAHERAEEEASRKAKAEERARKRAEDKEAEGRKLANAESEKKRVDDHLASLTYIDRIFSNDDECPFCTYTARSKNAKGVWTTETLASGTYFFKHFLSNKLDIIGKNKSERSGPTTAVAVDTEEGPCLWRGCITCSAEWLHRAPGLPEEVRGGRKKR